MIEEPKSEGKSATGHEVTAHPAYGMVRVGQVSGQAVLVGSAVKHGHFVTLEISTAERHKDNYSEFWHSKEVLCTVYMSHAQLAEMLFASSGSGVPCTLKHVRGDDDYRPEPPFVSPLKENSDDLHAVLKQTLSRASEMAKEVEAIFDIKAPKKADRDRAKFLALKIRQDIEDNMGFAMQCVDEKAEKIVAHAKAEIESFADMKFRNIGIAHLKEKLAQLEDKKED